MNQTAPTIADTCIFPVSASQRGLWLLEKLDGPNSAYNIPATLRIEGKLIPGILKESLRDLAERHEALRTAITEVDGEPQQTVYDAVEVEFSERYLNSVEVLEPILLSEAGKPFLLSEAPLWRVQLLHVSDDNQVLQINLHHAIADGYSLIVLFRDLVCFYNARLKGQLSGLPELPIQFAGRSPGSGHCLKMLLPTGKRNSRHCLPWSFPGVFHALIRFPTRVESWLWNLSRIR